MNVSIYMVKFKRRPDSIEESGVLIDDKQNGKAIIIDEDFHQVDVITIQVISISLGPIKFWNS